jgi:hypothetical protein
MFSADVNEKNSCIVFIIILIFARLKLSDVVYRV